MFRVKISKNEYVSDPKGDYMQWVDDIANQVTDAMQYLNYDFNKALIDTIDQLAPALMDWQTAAWVLQNSTNRDAYLSGDADLETSAQNALISMALSAIEEDVIGMLQGTYNVGTFGGETKVTPMQEMEQQFSVNPPNPAGADTAPQRPIRSYRITRR